MNLFDIGANLCNDAFHNDLDEVIEKAIDHHVTTLMVTGTNEKTSEAALTLALRHPDHLYSTAGIHPHDASQFNSNSYSFLYSLLQNDKVRAVGETGLDFNRDFSPRPKQIEVFERHLELANATRKPLFIHERDAHQDLYAMLKLHRQDFTQGVVHCFTGEKADLFRLLDLDLHIGITGWICDERRGKLLAEIVHNIPLNRLMIETDAPYLIPRDLKDNPYQLKPTPPIAKARRNEPCYLPHIAACIARCYGVDLDTIAENTTTTAKHFFGL